MIGCFLEVKNSLASFLIIPPPPQNKNPARNGTSRLPSSKLINFGEIKVLRSEATRVLIILENRDYMAIMKEKLIEIKQSYKGFKLSPLLDRRC